MSNGGATMRINTCCVSFRVVVRFVPTRDYEQALFARKATTRSRKEQIFLNFTVLTIALPKKATKP